MSSSISSGAQVYYDTGSGFNELESATVPVKAGSRPELLRLKLPHAFIKALRFDPLTSSGSIVIYRVVVLGADGSQAATFPLSRVRAVVGFNRIEPLSSGVRYTVRPDNNDPQCALDLQSPLDLRSRYPSREVITKLAVANALLLLGECLLLAAIGRGLFSAQLLRTVHPATALLVIPHLLLSWAYLSFSSSPPVLLVSMASSIYSRAQVYFDTGLGESEDQSSSVPVRPSDTPRELRLPLPFATIKSLRFDPLTSPGVITITRIEVLRPDGTTLMTFPLSRLRGVLGFERLEELPSGVRYTVRPDSYDPQLQLQLDTALNLNSRKPPTRSYLYLVFLNLGLLTLESFLLLKPGRKWFGSTYELFDSWAKRLAGRFGSEKFLNLDHLSIWFYFACVIVFSVLSAADWNGSSMGVFWTNYKVGAPATLIVGMPQQVRADEFNFQTPGMLNQLFREKRLDVVDSSRGGYRASLFAALPVRHITTWLRPQYWPFFVLPEDYAFSVWWQAKWLICVTGTFTFLLLLTGNSALALAGTAWIFFSQFTQWCYTWPSMLPEMGGLFCFTLVFACYLTVGSNKVGLCVAAVACSSCAMNFALMAYVPHLLPYAWTGVILFLAWCVARRSQVLNRIALKRRLIAGAGCLVLTLTFCLIVSHDTAAAVRGIAATVYPGHRSLNGGELSLTTFATHFLAASESSTRFPPSYSNICESSGFIWLAPVTLLCFLKMRGLSRDRQVLLVGLWIAFLLLAGWAILPIPASMGSVLFLNRVQGFRTLPALGLLNTAICTLVLSSAGQSRRLGFDSKFVIMLPVFMLTLVLANQQIDNYFNAYELILGGLWVAVAAALLWDGRRLLFSAAVVIPNLLMFSLINPVQHGIDVITSSTIFQLVQNNKRLLHGKWLIFPDVFPASIFTAAGCDVYSGQKYLPDVDHLALFKSHVLNGQLINNSGYLDIEELGTGQQSFMKKGPYGMILAISPLDPLVKDLGIRYMAFHKRPSEEVLARLKPLVNGQISEFWIYEFRE